MLSVCTRVAREKTDAPGFEQGVQKDLKNCWRQNTALANHGRNSAFIVSDTVP